MDIIATLLAVVTLLAVPFLLFFRSKARRRYQRDLAEIETLVAERSRYVNELHERLDTLEREGSQREPMISEKAVSNALRDLLVVDRRVAWLDIAAKRYSINLVASDIEALRLGMTCLRQDEVHHLWRFAPMTSPEWVKDADPRESAKNEDVRHKDMRKRKVVRPSWGPALQPL